MMKFCENLECDESGVVCGVETGRVVAKFSHVAEGESFVEHYNSQQLAQQPFVKRIAELEEAEEESLAVIDKLSHLLAEIAITVNGAELPLQRHSYHDLPELVAKQKATIDQYELTLGNCKLFAEWIMILSEEGKEIYKHKLRANADLTLSRIDKAMNEAKPIEKDVK